MRVRCYQCGQPAPLADYDGPELMLDNHRAWCGLPCTAGGVTLDEFGSRQCHGPDDCPRCHMREEVKA